ncbi:MAG: hypothetical protein J6Y88_05965 [Bacteroidales bacterium]|jgi:hypothetical protein|nr:hypothetical protein [Bacteroidales bacterium]
MKKLRVLLPAILLIAAPLLANAQAFSKDDPIGAEQVFVTTEAEGWVSDHTVFKIVDKKEAAGRTTLTISAISSTKEKKDAEPIETKLTVSIIYTANEIITPKENFTSAVSMLEKEFDGHKVKATFSGDDPAIPMQPKVGQKLADNEIRANIDIEGITAKMTLKDSDRRISAQERVSVPAGAYDAYVLEEASSAKVSVLIISETEKTTGKSWLVPGMGEVKSVTYDKKGKLMSTSEMISYTK